MTAPVWRPPLPSEQGPKAILDWRILQLSFLDRVGDEAGRQRRIFPILDLVTPGAWFSRRATAAGMLTQPRPVNMGFADPAAALALRANHSASLSRRAPNSAPAKSGATLTRPEGG